MIDQIKLYTGANYKYLLVYESLMFMNKHINTLKMEKAHIYSFYLFTKLYAYQMYENVKLIEVTLKRNTLQLKIYKKHKYMIFTNYSAFICMFDVNDVQRVERIWDYIF